MTKQKIKLSLIDDYISLFKILNFCTNGEDCTGNLNLEISNLKSDCENAISNFEKTFLDIGLFDASLKLVQRDLLDACQNPKTDKRIIVEKSKLKNYERKLNKISINLLEKISQITKI